LVKKLFAIALAMGLIVSPETLMVVGNAAGRAGYWLVFFIVLAAGVHMITAMAYAKAFILYPHIVAEVRLIHKAFGALPALCVPLCARVTVAVCASTAVLATAGYVFNEVFLYWFPNLGFSFGLLGVLLLINILGLRTTAWAQLVFVSVAIGGLVLLAMAGLLEWGHPPVQSQDVSTPLAHLVQIGMAGLLVFVGFDLACFSENSRQSPVKAMVVAIVLAGMLFVCWGWVSAKYVALGRLAETSIPHVKTARAVLGQTGRIWMGVIILAGASAAVNALLTAVSKMMAAMAEEGLLPPFFAKGKRQTTVGVIVLGAAVAAMMATGMAGEPILEVYMKAGVCIWLVHYAVILGAALMLTMRTWPDTPGPGKRGLGALFVVGLAAVMWAVAGVFVLATERVLLLKIVFVILASGLAFGVFWIPLSKKRVAEKG
jgi:amino acid transporter